jgi:hypothetical protein
MGVVAYGRGVTIFRSRPVRTRPQTKGKNREYVALIPSEQSTYSLSVKLDKGRLFDLSGRVDQASGLFPDRGSLSTSYPAILQAFSDSACCPRRLRKIQVERIDFISASDGDYHWRSIRHHLRKPAADHVAL